MGSNEAPSSTTPLKIPFIDFSKPLMELKPGTPYWDSLKPQVREALQVYGCFEAHFDKVRSELRSGVFDSFKEFFDLPLSTKRLNVSEVPYHGYLGQLPTLPLYESMGIDDPNLIHKVESLTNTFWPSGNPSFSKNIVSLSEKIAELDQIVRTMIVESLGVVEEHVDEHMNSTRYFARAMKYEATPEPKLGLATHVDKNMISTLYTNHNEGLEVQAKNGEWVRFRPSSTAGSFVVIVGESLHAWLNGRVHCPNHRVMLVSGNEVRYTFAVFTTPKPGYLIRAPEELVDEEHPLLFKPFEYNEYLAFARAATVRNVPAPLSAYCGL